MAVPRMPRLGKGRSKGSPMAGIWEGTGAGTGLGGDREFRASSLIWELLLGQELGGPMVPGWGGDENSPPGHIPGVGLGGCAF